VTPPFNQQTLRRLVFVSFAPNGCCRSTRHPPTVRGASFIGPLNSHETAEHTCVQWRFLYVNDPGGNQVELVAYDPATGSPSCNRTSAKFITSDENYIDRLSLLLDGTLR